LLDVEEGRLRLYENSLFLVFLSLFILSMVIHAFSGARVQLGATRAR
jgi:succinate dehydrogenase hydrophobic anchor subunit